MVCAYAGACDVHAHMRARNGAGNVREAYALWRSRDRRGRACTLHAPAGQNGTLACASRTEWYARMHARACEVPARMLDRTVREVHAFSRSRRNDTEMNWTSSVPKTKVKRHRGEPGHTRDTRNTRTHKGTQTTQTNLTTIETHQQHTPRTSARRPKPRPTQQPQARYRLRSASR